MGMFDTITNPDGITCQNCDAVIKDFQSKDGDKLLDTFSPVDFWVHANRAHTYVYDVCPECNFYNEFELKLEVTFVVNPREHVRKRNESRGF